MGDEKALRETLDQLRRQLHDMPEANDDLRQLLKATVEDIDDVLDPNTPTQNVPNSVRDRLGEAMAQMEVNHPTLTGTVEKLVDILANMGI